jgi:hypothetical protein
MNLICSLLIGVVISEKDRCSTCRGKKVVNETKILDVHIDKGMREGQKIYFRGEGDQQVNIMEFQNINVLNCCSLVVLAQYRINSYSMRQQKICVSQAAFWLQFSRIKRVDE